MTSDSSTLRWFDWLYQIRFRFLAVHVLLVAVPLGGVRFARFHEREMMRSLEEDMIHQGAVLRQTMLADPSGLRLNERTPWIRGIARQTQARIRLLNAQGDVVT